MFMAWGSGLFQFVRPAEAVLTSHLAGSCLTRPGLFKLPRSRTWAVTGTVTRTARAELAPGRNRPGSARLPQCLSPKTRIRLGLAGLGGLTGTWTKSEARPAGRTLSSLPLAAHRGASSESGSLSP